MKEICGVFGTSAASSSVPRVPIQARVSDAERSSPTNARQSGCVGSTTRYTI
jgi:hypothetical protein